jgi:hypothetical protein
MHELQQTAGTSSDALPLPAAGAPATSAACVAAVVGGGKGGKGGAALRDSDGQATPKATRSSASPAQADLITFEPEISIELSSQETNDEDILAGAIEAERIVDEAAAAALAAACLEAQARDSLAGALEAERIADETEQAELAAALTAQAKLAAEAAALAEQEAAVAATLRFAAEKKELARIQRSPLDAELDEAFALPLPTDVAWPKSFCRPGSEQATPAATAVPAPAPAPDDAAGFAPPSDGWARTLAARQAGSGHRSTQPTAAKSAPAAAPKAASSPAPWPLQPANALATASQAAPASAAESARPRAAAAAAAAVPSQALWAGVNSPRIAPVPAAGPAGIARELFPDVPMAPTQLETPGDVTSDAPISATGVETLLQQSEERITGAVQASQASLGKALQSEMHTLFRKFDASLQLQFQAQEQEIARLSKITKDAESNFDRLWTELSNLRQSLIVSKSVENTMQFEAEQKFDAMPDKSVLVLRCNELIDKRAAGFATAGLCDADLIEDRDFTIRGSDTSLAKRWVFAIGGEAGLAAWRGLAASSWQGLHLEEPHR